MSWPRQGRRCWNGCGDGSGPVLTVGEMCLRWPWHDIRFDAHLGKWWAVVPTDEQKRRQPLH
eukprot:12922321-Prorocentrum_lima.AAC.1